MESINLLLKTFSYLKACPARFPGAQSASLHPELPPELLKVNSYSSMEFSLHRGGWRVPVVPSSAVLLVSADVWLTQFT